MADIRHAHIPPGLIRQTDLLDAIGGIDQNPIIARCDKPIPLPHRIHRPKDRRFQGLIATIGHHLRSRRALGCRGRSEDRLPAANFLDHVGECFPRLRMAGHLPIPIAIGIIQNRISPDDPRSPSHAAQFFFRRRSRRKGRREVFRSVGGPVHGLDHRVELLAACTRGRRTMTHVLKEGRNRNPTDGIEIHHQEIGRVELG